MVDVARTTTRDRTAAAGRPGRTVVAPMTEPDGDEPEDESEVSADELLDFDSLLAGIDGRGIE
jgi:hypothetical protein